MEHKYIASLGFVASVALGIPAVYLLAGQTKTSPFGTNWICNPQNRKQLLDEKREVQGCSV